MLKDCLTAPPIRATRRGAKLGQAATIAGGATPGQAPRARTSPRPGPLARATVRLRLA